MFEIQRKRMVQKFVIDPGIKDDAVIAAMNRVPRHLFVESALSHEAYSGSSLPIGFRQTISHPTTVALMTQALQLTGHEKILEIGTGSGYQAAVLAELGVKVFTIERIEGLAQRARQIFEKLHYFTIAVHVGDGSKGWLAHAPYDRIIATAAAPKFPEILINQLADGGRMIVPVADKDSQKLVVITREGDQTFRSEKEWRSFVPMIGENGW